MRRAPIFRTRRTRNHRFVVWPLLALGSLAWSYGLAQFSGQIPGEITDTETPTDAIVVLTGGSERLEAGIALYRSAMGTKLFISGVNERVQVQDILPAETTGTDNAGGGIELGYHANDTIGNARETAQWMAEKGFRSLRLVTASYHMPRSLLEFHYAIPEVKIIPHSVFPKTFHRNHWWRWPGSARLVLVEYHKFLLVHLRIFVMTAAGRFAA